LLSKLSAGELAELLRENADEPHAEPLAAALAGRSFATTGGLREAIARVTGSRAAEERELTVRRVFQALRIAVNDEFSALEAFLRVLPDCLAPGGRVAILTFHSGEDRRVKKSFAENERHGRYAGIATEVLRPSAAERHQNPRSTSAKLRWARRGLP
jgi:16S rRNA (cytosine1402-N4)-methyltransferase